MRRSELAFVGFIGLIAITASARAGDLSPPSGPITETGRFGPRTEVNADNTPGDADSLFKITAPGSYYLGGNLTGVAAKHGIKIDANNVTLDLHGFSLIGVVGSLNGIHVTEAGFRTPRLAIVIEGPGQSFSWGVHGVNALDSIRSVISDVHCTDNTGRGLDIGDSARVLRCTAEFNGQGGIRTGLASVVSECIARMAVTGTGIEVGSNSSVSRCSADLNAGDGISVGPDSTVSLCTGSTNGGAGLRVSGGCVVAECSANRNLDTGILITAFNSRVVNCTAAFNTLNGFQFERYAIVEGCVASNNGEHGFSFTFFSQVQGCFSVANDVDGFRTDGSTFFLDCRASINASNGFQIAADSSVIGCFVNGNQFPGIVGFSNSHIANNYVDGSLNPTSGGAIAISGGHCRVDNNYITGGLTGVRAIGAFHLIIRNVAVENTVNFDIDGIDCFIACNVASGGAPNYSIVAGNSVAPRVGVVASDGWAGIINADHPWANFGF